MLLPYIYRFSVKNEGGTDIGIGGAKVVGLRNRIDASGILVYESSEATLLENSSILLNSGYLPGTTQTNTVGWYGGDFLCSVTGNIITSNMQVIFYFERATNSSSPTFDSSGMVAAIITSGSPYRAISI